MATFSIKFQTPDGATSIDLSVEAWDWQEDVPMRINPVTIPRRHGAKISEEPTFEPRIVEIPVSFHGTTLTEARDNFEAKVSSIPYGLGRLYKYNDRYVNAYWMGYQGYRYANGSAGLVINASLRFFCPDPFYYTTTSASDTDTVNASRATGTFAAAGANNDLTFTSLDSGPLANNVRVEFVSAGAESITTASANLSAAITLGAAAANADLTFTAATAGVAGQNIRIKMVSGTEELVEVRVKDIKITYNAGTSTANTIKTAYDGNADAIALATVAVEGTGAGIWVAGDAQGFTHLARGQNRTITVNFNATVSTASTLKTAIDANDTANDWVTVAVEGTGAGTWAAGDAQGPTALTGAAVGSWAIANSGTDLVYPKFTFTPAGGSTTSFKALQATNFPGRSFDFQGTVAAAAALVLDSANFKVTNAGTADLDNWKTVDATASDVLWIQASNNTIEVTWIGAATSVAVKAEFKTRWI